MDSPASEPSTLSIARAAKRNSAVKRSFWDDTQTFCASALLFVIATVAALSSAS